MRNKFEEAGDVIDRDVRGWVFGRARKTRNPVHLSVIRYLELCVLFDFSSSINFLLPSSGLERAGRSRSSVGNMLLLDGLLPGLLESRISIPKRLLCLLMLHSCVLLKTCIIDSGSVIPSNFDENNEIFRKIINFSQNFRKIIKFFRKIRKISQKLSNFCQLCTFE